MTEVPGAREELDRARDRLRELFAALVTELTGDPGPRVPNPGTPQIAAGEESGEALRFEYSLHMQDLVPAEGVDDPARVAAEWLERAGWRVALNPARPPYPAGAEARLGESRLRVGTRPETGLLTITAYTPEIRLHEPRSAAPTPPGCPRCDRPLAWFRLGLPGGHSRPGRPGRLRPETWWECSGCDWLGWQRHEGEGLVPMLRRTSAEGGDCYRCGEEAATAVTEPRLDADRHLTAWAVCLACGTSNGMRWKPSLDR
ncbi:hypothetical protein AB0I28_19220 [Phytomonospora sp. NPDC050363]|uniref:hypothetical protein n=1 Tax=Phytomonospora sp. NPDC050363 TaxID=3155642 RepID=UPI0033FCA792